MKVNITSEQIIKDLNKEELEELKTYISNAERFYKNIAEKHPGRNSQNRKTYAEETAIESGLDVKYCLIAWDYLP